MKKLYLYFLIFLALVIGIFVLATSPKKEMKNPVITESDTPNDATQTQSLDQVSSQNLQKPTNNITSTPSMDGGKDDSDLTSTSTATPTFIDINQDDNSQNESGDSTDNQEASGDIIESLHNTCDSSYVYGQTSVNYSGTVYKINDEKNAILKGDSSFYTAPKGFTIQKFNYTGTYLYIIEKNEDGLTYEFVRVTPSNGRRSLFFRWISHENMEDFLINPATFSQNKVFYLLLTRVNSKPRVIVVENYHYSTSVWGDKTIKPFSEKAIFYCSDENKITVVYESGEDLVTEDFTLN